MSQIKIAVSSCLLGNRVRYDGGHKRNSYLTDTLAHQAELIPICPEVAIGLGVPRPPIQLVQTGSETHAIGVDDPTLDVTQPLQHYARQMLQEFNELSGLILQNRSPSCGLRGVQLIEDSRTTLHGSGIFAHTITQANPQLPVIESESLDDPELRNNFLRRVTIYQQKRQQIDGR